MARPLRSTGAPFRLGLALLISVLSGVLVAGLAFPLVGGIGLLAKSGTDDFLAMPAALDTPALETRSRVLAADGSLLATFYRVNRVAAPAEAIPPVMKQAIVAIEDSRFYEHNGVDFKGTLRAALTNARTGRVEQGGSTLTQQYVKNALIEAATDKAGQQAATEESADRKLREARYALALERTLTKDEILTRYLNIAYFGNGVYGVGTAATYYFGKPVDQLTLAESALLAGVVQNPTRYNIASKDEAVRADVVARRDVVLARMRDLGLIPEEVRAQTTAIPLPEITPTTVGSGCEDPAVTAPFFCDWVRHELEETPVGAALGVTKEERQNKLLGGGLVIQTTLDPKVQAAAQAAVDSQVPNGDPSGVAAVSDVVEPGTGDIKAMAVDRPYGDDPAKGETKVNLPAGGVFGYQPGSTFKAFFLAGALQQGIPLSTRIYSPAKYYPKAFPYKGDDGKPQAVSNAGDSESGTFDLRSGTAESVNTFYIQLAERTGLEKPLALAESLGVHVLDHGQELPLPRVASAVLGSATVSPIAMAGAYAAFAAHGKYCPPRAVRAINGPSGPVALPPDGCTQAMESSVADTVTSVLQGVIDGPNAKRTGASASIGRPAAGKTGTTNSSRAAWFVGYTPQLSTAVWVGNPAAPTPMTKIKINRRYYTQVFGGTIPAAVWRSTMRGALTGVPVARFERADPTAADDVPGDSRTVPDVVGLTYDDAAAKLRAAGFAPVAARYVSSSRSYGRTAYTSPRTGSSAAPGATVYVYRSSGSVATRAPVPTRSTTAAPRATSTTRPPTTTRPATTRPPTTRATTPAPAR